MKRQRMIVSLFLVSAIAAVMAAPPAAALSGSWSVVPNPSTQTELTGVAATQSNDVWAVGTSTIEHWNGSSWSVSLFRYDVFFQDIAAVSTSDAWAVGGSGKPSVFRWNGVSWTQFTIPVATGVLGGVDAISPTDVWAVGSAGFSTMVQHWNGSAWSMVPSANPATGHGTLNAVSAVSSADIWAVGSTIDGLLVHPLIEHWNGIAWTIVPAPATTTELSLRDVTAVGTNDVWAVGFSRTNQTYQPRIVHWNGAAWTFAKLPPLPANGTLEGVAARTATDVWAVGGVPNSTGYTKTMILHWDGTAWSRVPSPNPAGTTSIGMLNDVTTLPTGEAWSVGRGGLIERRLP